MLQEIPMSLGVGKLTEELQVVMEWGVLQVQYKQTQMQDFQ